MYQQGDHAEVFYVLLDGEIQLVKRLDGTDVVLTTASQPGAYAGATRAFISTSGDQSYVSSLRTVTRYPSVQPPRRGLLLRAEHWFPMAVHLLDGLFLGITNAEALLGQRDKLIALGCALRRPGPRAQQPGRSRGAGRRSAQRHAAGRTSGPDQPGRQLDNNELPNLLDLLGEAVESARRAPSLSPLEAGDLEDTLAAKLEAAGVDDPWDLAPALVSAGLDEAWLARVDRSHGDGIAVRPALVVARDRHRESGQRDTQLGRAHLRTCRSNERLQPS